MYEYENVIFQLLTQIFCTMSEVTQNTRIKLLYDRLSLLNQLSRKRNYSIYYTKERETKKKSQFAKLEKIVTSNPNFS